MLFKNNIRMMIDSNIGDHFLEGLIDSFRKNKIQNQIFMISGGGSNFYLTINLFAKRYYKEEEDFYKSVSNTIPETDPFYFLSLSEYDVKTKVTAPAYFVLNGKENNYKVKLLQASKKQQNDALSINGNLYYNCRTTDPLPIIPLLNDFNHFLGIYVVTKENYSNLLERLETINSTNIIIVQERNDYDEAFNLTSLTIEKFFDKKMIKKGNLDKLTTKLNKFNSLYKEEK